MNEPKQLISLPLDLVARSCKIPSKASQDANHQDIIDRGRAQEELRGILANPAAIPTGEPILIQAVAVTRADGEDGLRLEWLLEGGIAEMEFPEQVLFAMPEANDFCDADGSGYVYLQPHAEETGETDRLREDLEMVKNEDLKWQGLREQEAEIQLLRAQLAAAQLDATRFRFIVDCPIREAVAIARLAQDSTFDLTAECDRLIEKTGFNLEKARAAGNQTTSLPHGARLVGFVDQGQAKITLEHALKAYNYACDHPHGYLRGTTNWCAAFAHSLNQQMNSENAADGTATE